LDAYSQNLRQPHPLDGQQRPSGGARVPENASILAVRRRPDASFSICFGVGIRQDAGRAAPRRTIRRDAGRQRTHGDLAKHIVNKKSARFEPAILSPRPGRVCADPATHGCASFAPALLNRLRANADMIRPLSQALTAMITAPAAIKLMPSQPDAEGRSPRKTNANRATRTTLNLSIGATSVAGPSLSARK
jgi:hypothetical protein